MINHNTHKKMNQLKIKKKKYQDALQLFLKSCEHLEIQLDPKLKRSLSLQFSIEKNRRIYNNSHSCNRVGKSNIMHVSPSQSKIGNFFQGQKQVQELLPGTLLYKIINSK